MKKWYLNDTAMILKNKAKQMLLKPELNIIIIEAL